MLVYLNDLSIYILFLAKKHKAMSTPFRDPHDPKSKKKEGGWFSSIGGMIAKAFW
jgi:hypothetical protein